MIFRSLTILCLIGALESSAVRSKRSDSFEVTASENGLDRDIDNFFASKEFPDTSEVDDDQVPRTKAEMTNQVFGLSQILRSLFTKFWLLSKLIIWPQVSCLGSGEGSPRQG
jgi:hypothetical protein